MTPTQRNEMERRTSVFDDDLCAYPLDWRCYDVKRLYGFMGDMREIDTVGGTVDAPVMGYIMEGNHFMEPLKSAGDLPVEFFNHELMEVDVDSEPSVYSFVSTWGFPYSPSRNPATTPIVREDYELDRRFKKACRATNRLAGSIREIREDEARAAGELGANETSAYDYGDSVISLDEAALTIRALQEQVLAIRAHFTKGVRVDFTLINRASCNPYHVRQHMFLRHERSWSNYKSLDSYGLLTSAICNQIVETIADETQWRACACEGCDVVFKRKRAGSSSPYAESVYCCKKCEERQKKRNQREAAKNRLAH